MPCNDSQQQINTVKPKIQLECAIYKLIHAPTHAFQEAAKRSLEAYKRSISKFFATLILLTSKTVYLAKFHPRFEPN